MKRIALILATSLTGAVAYAQTTVPVTNQITDSVTQAQHTELEIKHTELELRVAALQASLDELTRRKNIDDLRVYFDFDEYTPNIGSTGPVDVVTKFMKDYPNYVLTIEGHTDERGTREYNLSLGERRANAVKTMMIESGINPNRIKTISYGKERPEFPYANTASWQKNRRVVFILAN